MVRANRPWRLIARLSRALAASLTAVAVAVVTSDVWRISDRLGWPDLLALSVGAVVVTVGWLIADHGLWERPASERRREQAVLFNVVTTLTVALGVACLYAALFTLTLVVARVMIDPGLMGEELGHPARLGDYAGLAWLVSSMATVGGALGAALESDSAVREAAYGYRPERQAERDARVDSQ
jgi:hypothetical protein